LPSQFFFFFNLAPPYSEGWVRHCSAVIKKEKIKRLSLRRKNLEKKFMSSVALAVFLFLERYHIQKLGVSCESNVSLSSKTA